MWLLEQEIPEQYKPDVCGVISKYERRNDQRIVFLIKAPNMPSKDMVSWFESFVDQRGYGLIWNDETDTPVFYNIKH